jgi:hypothetical protein
MPSAIPLASSSVPEGQQQTRDSFIGSSVLFCTSDSKACPAHHFVSAVSTGLYVTGVPADDAAAAALGSLMKSSIS